MTDRYEIVAERKSAALWAVWDIPHGSSLRRIGALYCAKRKWCAVCYTDHSHIEGVGPLRGHRAQALEDLCTWWHGPEPDFEEDEDDCGVEELCFE